MRRWRILSGNGGFALLAVALLALAYSRLAAPLNALLCRGSFQGATAALRLLGVEHGAEPAEQILRGPAFAIEVSGLCSGLRGIALWTAAALCLPLSLRRRVGILVVGLLVLCALNVLRIVHLFRLQSEGSAYFVLCHEWLWPCAIVAGILVARHLIARGAPDDEDLSSAT